MIRATAEAKECSLIEAYQRMIDNKTLHWNPTYITFKTMCSRYAIKFKGKKEYMKRPNNTVVDLLAAAGIKRQLGWVEVAHRILEVAAIEGLIDSILDDD